jgi:transcriptional regulator, cro/CI family, putative
MTKSEFFVSFLLFYDIIKIEVIYMNRLKELRQKKGDTQEVVAKAMGVTRRGYQKWENGESQIKTDKAQQLADYFEVSVGYLLGYDVKIAELKSDLLASSEELEKTAREAFYLANSNLEIKLKGIDDTINLLIEGIKEEKLSKEPILEALEFIKEYVQSIDEIVNKITEYQAKYTAEQLWRYKLEKSVNKEN